MLISLLCIIFFTGFFGNTLKAYALIPPYATLVTEISVYILFLYSLVLSAKRHESYRLDLSWLWILFLVIAASSVIVNDYINLRPIFSLRLLLRFYLLYLALINLNLSDSELKKINNLIIFLFLIQLPAVAYKFSIYGVSERTIGTYALRGGGLTTMFPIIVISYCMSWYVLYKKSVWYLLISTGFIIWGIVGAKAALFYLYPVTFLGLYYLLVIKRIGFKIVENSITISMLFVITVIVLSLLVSLQPRLNKERKIGGEVDFQYVLKFSKEYSTGEKCDNPQYTVGRFATTKLAFKQFFNDGFTVFIFGYGPGSITPSILSVGPNFDSRVENIAKSYGISGMVHIWVEYGIFGVLLICFYFILFCWRSWKWYNVEKDKYWKGFAAGTLAFCMLNLFIFLTYNRVPINDETLLPVFYYVIAAMYKKHIIDNENVSCHET